MREIKYTISLDGVSPSNVQFGGMQGEHNATRLNVEISGDLLAKLEGAGYRFEAEDGAGCRQTIVMSEVASENIVCPIPQSVTSNGGNVTIRLIFSKVSETEIEYILYSFPMKLRFDLTSNGEFTENKEASDVSAAISLAKGYTEKAERFAESAENSAELAVNAREGIEQEIANSLMEAKNSGEFDGADGKDGKDGTDGKDGMPATHSWNGTVLTITSASGTSSADLKGEKGDKGESGAVGAKGDKGDKGDKGEKGEDGADYVLTDDDKSEIANRVNAVSYSQSQNLTEEQKITARGNIGVFSQDEVAYMINDSIKETVPKTDVVDNLLINGAFDLTKIPNGNALNAFIVQTAVSSGATQSLSEAKKARARENISAMVNKEWKVIATSEITEDGVTKIAITKDNNGKSFEIYDALVVYTDAPIATETANIFLYINGQPSNLAFQALHKSEKRFSRITANWDGGNWAGISLVGSNSYSWATSVGGMTQYNAKRSPATWIELSTENANAPFPIGTKFELRGVVKV